MIDLLPVKCICIHSNFGSNSFLTHNINSKSIITSIPVSTPAYSLITYTNLTGHKVNLNTDNINFITIRLTDQDGNILIMDNNIHYVITLQIDAIEYTA
jgi:hypothetical protein